MTSSVAPADLTPEEEIRLHEILDRFARAWHETDSIDVSRYLPPVGDRLRVPVLWKLLTIDLEKRWQRQQTVYLETYLKYFPELEQSNTLMPRLLYEEYRVRQQYGDKPSLAAYETRFPMHVSAMAKLVRARAPSALVSASASQSPDTLGPTSPPAGNSNEEILQVGGGYRMVRRLGSGSFGEVWLAEAPGGFDAALKLIFRPIAHADASRELRSLNLIRHLHHPYLLHTHGFWVWKDRVCIAMELADGNLRDRLQECKRDGLTSIPVPELLGYFKEIAEALDYLHSKDVLHRDIKPDNILLLARHAKLADFGLARLQETQSPFAATSTGTPAYMATEVWRGHVSAKSDQYSLAVTYVEVRAGQPPFPSGNMAELMVSHLEREPELELLPEKEQQVLRKALSKDPSQRYGSCQEFVQALEKVLAPEPPQTQPSDPPKQVQASSGAFPQLLRWGVLSSFGCILLIGLLIFLWRSEKVPPIALSPPPPIFLPVDCEPEPDAELVTDEERRLYDRIALVRPETPRIHFLLIPKEGPTDPTTFYIMDTKVSNELYHIFAENKHDPVQDARWLKEGKNFLGDLKLPVFFVTGLRAHEFAKWLGGELPTTQQWDKAGGRFNGEKGPFKGDDVQWPRGAFALRRDDDPSRDRSILGASTLGLIGSPQGHGPFLAASALYPGRTDPRPLPVGAAFQDLSRFGCRDMASNGREWTRNEWGPNGRGQPVDFQKLSDSSICLRGVSYHHSEPFNFKEHLDNDQEQVRKAARDISFRVVLELPMEP